MVGIIHRQIEMLSLKMILNEKKSGSERSLDSEALDVKLKALIQEKGLRNEGRVGGRATCCTVDTNSL